MTGKTLKTSRLRWSNKCLKSLIPLKKQNQKAINLNGSDGALLMCFCKKIGACTQRKGLGMKMWSNK